MEGCCLPPFVRGGKGFAGESRICSRFVPTHSRHWMIRRPLGIRSKTPARRTDTSAEIAKLRNRLLPRNRAPIFEEGFGPVFWFLVAAGIEKFLELAVCNFTTVDPESGNRKLRRLLARLCFRDPHHAGRSCRRRMERRYGAAAFKYRIRGGKTVLDEAGPVITPSRQLRGLNRRLADEFPCREIVTSAGGVIRN